VQESAGDLRHKQQNVWRNAAGMDPSVVNTVLAGKWRPIRAGVGWLPLVTTGGAYFPVPSYMLKDLDIHVLSLLRNVSRFRLRAHHFQ